MNYYKDIKNIESQKTVTLSSMDLDDDNLMDED